MSDLLCTKASPTRSLPQLGKALPGEQGDFLVQGAPWGRVSLRVWPRDYIPARWTVNVEEGEHKRDIELVLEAGAEITGVVRFLDGAPAFGVKLNARPDMAALADIRV